jgi:general secretion pathway protein I
MSRSRGFTLIEVLVALAVAALGLSAVLSIVSSSARNASALRERTLAGYVGLNRLTTLRLQPGLPPVDRTTGELDFAGNHWKWQQTVTQTDVPGIRRIDIKVRGADDPEDASRAAVTGFVGHAQTSAPPSAIPWDGLGGTAPGGPGGPTGPATPGLPSPSTLPPGTTPPSPQGTPR